jgi:tetratricopeptide (TPR) repeat protein
MKSVLASVALCALLFTASCSQSPEKLLATANKYHDNKKYDEASILYQKVLLKDKTNAEAYYRLGLNYLSQGNPAGALQALRRAVDLKPTNTDAEAKLGEIYLLAYNSNPKAYKGLLSDLIDLDHKMLQQNPNSFEGLRLEGLVGLVSHDSEKALASLAKANQIKPFDPSVVGPYSQALIASGKQDEAISLIRETLNHDKSWGAGYVFLASFYARAKQNDKADSVLREWTEANPASAEAILQYSRYKLQTGDYSGAEQLMKTTLNNPKAFPNARMMLGDFYLLAGKPDLALASFEQGAKDQPKDAVPYQEQIVRVKAATNHVEDALSLAKSIVDKNPKNANASELYANLLLRINTRSSAANTLTEIKKLSDANAGNSMLHIYLGQAFFVAGQRDKALTEGQLAVSNEQKAQHPRGAVVAQAQLLVARVYSDRSDNDSQHKALSQAQLILDSAPGNPDALIIKDRALIFGKPYADPYKQDYDVAQADLEGLVQHLPNIPEAHFQLGTIYLAENKYDKATEQFTIASKLNPRDMRGFIGIQNVKLQSGHSADAVQAMQDLVSKNPTNLGARFELANFQASAATLPENRASSKQLFQQAADNYKEILKTNATSSEIWLRLGNIQSSLGQSEAALASFEQASNTDPKNVRALMSQALLLETLNRSKEATDFYNRVLSIDPNQWEALNNLAYLAAESGSNLNQAQTYAEHAKKEVPESAEVADTLGYVYLQKNLNTQAAEIFRQNVAQHPDNANFRFHLAMALLKQGDKAGAKEQASKALQSASTNTNLQTKIRTFVGQIG